MSTITNEPILLDATGRAMLERMDRQNALLSMIVEGRRADIYNDVKQIAGIVRGGTVETNKMAFPIGDQIIVPWKDMDDPVHNTDETAYQVEWDIVHHAPVTLQDGSVVPGMFLMMHKCSVYGVQYGNVQAFYKSNQGLPAGTYHINFDDVYNDTFTPGTSGQFTLTKDLPAGGLLALSEENVRAWETAESAEVAETVSMTLGSGGIDLGTLSNNRFSNDASLNMLHKAKYGHNRWSTSAIRQYLNADGLNWYHSKEDFDIRPGQYNKHGFMSGFNDDFLSAIKPVKVTTALNKVEGVAEATEDTFDTFFLPSLEQMNIKPELPGVEGDRFEYWRRRLGLDGFINYSWEAEPNKSAALLIPSIDTNLPQNVRLRSAYRIQVYYTWTVHSVGDVHNNSASSAFRFTPVCVIC